MQESAQECERLRQELTAVAEDMAMLVRENGAAASRVAEVQQGKEIAEARLTDMQTDLENQQTLQLAQAAELEEERRAGEVRNRQEAMAQDGQSPAMSAWLCARGCLLARSEACASRRQRPERLSWRQRWPGSGHNWPAAAGSWRRCSPLTRRRSASCWAAQRTFR